MPTCLGQVPTVGDWVGAGMVTVPWSDQILRSELVVFWCFLCLASCINQPKGRQDLPHGRSDHRRWSGEKMTSTLGVCQSFPHKKWKANRNVPRPAGCYWLPSFLTPAVLMIPWTLFSVWQSLPWLLFGNKSFVLNSSVSVLVQLRFLWESLRFSFISLAMFHLFPCPLLIFLDRFHFPNRCLSFLKTTSTYSRFLSFPLLLTLFLSSSFLLSF